MESSFEYRSMKRPRSRSRSRSPSPSYPSRSHAYPRGPPRNSEWDRAPPTRGYNHSEYDPYSRRMDDDSNARRTEDDPLEEQRRLKMAKLRAENEAEERRLADIRKAALKSSLDTSTTTEKNQAGDAKEKILEIQEGELDEYEEEEQMQMLLGFSNGFTSTKGKAVEDNQTSAAKGAAAKNKARKYRQYMNRKGGFNRPLDKMN